MSSFLVPSVTWLAVYNTQSCHLRHQRPDCTESELIYLHLLSCQVASCWTFDLYASSCRHILFGLCNSIQCNNLKICRPFWLSICFMLTRCLGPLWWSAREGILLDKLLSQPQLANFWLVASCNMLFGSTYPLRFFLLVFFFSHVYLLHILSCHKSHMTIAIEKAARRAQQRVV